MHILKTASYLQNRQPCFYKESPTAQGIKYISAQHSVIFPFTPTTEKGSIEEAGTRALCLLVSVCKIRVKSSNWVLKPLETMEKERC